MISINPFSENRAELLSDLWKYYVPFEEIDIDDSKPIILEGGRGTGKTMFFQCNSWQEQLSEFSTGDNDTQHTHALEKIISLNRLGIYYKVDIAFIGVMEGESIPHSQWIGLFNTYLALCILKKVFEFLYLCEQTNLFGANDILEVSRAYYRCIRGDESRKCYSFKTLINDCDKALDIVEDIVNTQHYDSSILRLTTAGTAVNVIYKKIKEIKIFEKLVLKIFIDECESLSEWQQKIINTLVKHSDNKIVYNIGTRPCGIKTVETMGIDGASEIIQEVHDYKYIRLDDIFILSKKYVALLEKICEKRLSLIQDKCKAKGKIPVDIKYYLGEYSIKQEIARFEESGKNAPHRQWLKDKIIEQSEQQEKNALYINVLCDEASLLESRLHYAILLRAKQYRPSLENLLSAYLAWKNNGKAEEKKQYSNWMHNAETGLIFLLANELRMSKLYYGFDTFVKLSSGVIRYFLELCEQAFNLALNDNFDWNNVQMIPCEVQSRAARYVSKYKIDEIVTYPKLGRELRIFVQCLGTIFKDLHRNKNLTLGEPEPNHFTTSSLGLGRHERKLVDTAINWNVLQELKQTKGKKRLDTSIVDYHLNKIYAPYFDISYKKKRKIEFSPEYLSALFSGDMARAKEATRAYLENYWKNKNQSSENQEIKNNSCSQKLSSKGNQLSLFDEMGDYNAD